jgi:hypothetical protein
MIDLEVFGRQALIGYRNSIIINRIRPAVENKLYLDSYSSPYGFRASNLFWQGTSHWDIKALSIHPSAKSSSINKAWIRAPLVVAREGTWSDIFLL